MSDKSSLSVGSVEDTLVDLNNTITSTSSTVTIGSTVPSTISTSGNVWVAPPGSASIFSTIYSSVSHEEMIDALEKLYNASWESEAKVFAELYKQVLKLRAERTQLQDELSSLVGRYMTPSTFY